MRKLILLGLLFCFGKIFAQSGSGDFKALHIQLTDSTQFVKPANKGSLVYFSQNNTWYIVENGVKKRLRDFSSGGSAWPLTGTATLTGDVLIDGSNDIMLGHLLSNVNGFEVITSNHLDDFSTDGVHLRARDYKAVLESYNSDGVFINAEFEATAAGGAVAKSSVNTTMQSYFGDDISSGGSPTVDFTLWGPPTSGPFGSGGAVFTDSRGSVKGIQYAGSGYVTDALSLTTKEYVDAAVAGGGGSVTSVFGRSGVVVATSGDYSISDITNGLSNALSSGHIFVGDVSNIATDVAVSGDGTLSSSGVLTINTLNQNTTGSAAKWTTARNLAGNSVDGSGNVSFTNKFIVQGTTDAGLSNAQFLGALTTGLVKNTTTTGVLSIAVSGTDYQAPITFGTGVLTALGINVGSSGAFVVNGGALGTPLSGVATNLTGTASGLTAGNVTTNANLTGPITSSGNATSVAGGVNWNTALSASLGSGWTTALNSSYTTGLSAYYTFNSQAGNYTLVIGDGAATAITLVQMTSASSNNLTVPPNSSVAFTIGTQILVRQTGAGLTTFVQGAGVTITSTSGFLVSPGQGYVSVLTKTGTNTWTLDNGSPPLTGAAVTTALGYTPWSIAGQTLSGNAILGDLGTGGYSLSIKTNNTNRLVINSKGDATYTQDVETSAWANTFLITPGAHTGITATLQNTNFKIAAVTQTWLGSATPLALQTFNRIEAPTVAVSGGTGSLTMTEVNNVFIAAPIQGTGSTITNNYSLGLGSSLHLSGNVYSTGVASNFGTTDAQDLYLRVNLTPRVRFIATGATNFTDNNWTFTGAATAGTINPPFYYIAGASTTLTAGRATPLVKFDMSATQQWSSGALPLDHQFMVIPSTLSITGAASVATLVSSFDVVGGPSGGTNMTLTTSTGINVETKTLANTTNGYAAILNAPSGATNNWALQLVGRSNTSDDISFTDATKGIILKDTQGTPHFWRITVSNIGVLTVTDVGTSIP